MTVKQALSWAVTLLATSPQLTNHSFNRQTANLEAEILLLQALTLAGFNSYKNKAWLYAHLDYKLPGSVWQRFTNFIQRRLQGEPVAYILKSKEFFKLNFFVDKRVLIPRPETELLVELVIREVQENQNKIHLIADIGTGSGCIAIALAKNLPNIKIIATDISTSALTVACWNAKKHKVSGQITFLPGDLLKPLLKYRAEIIVANLPYLPINQKVKEKSPLSYEPATALYAGPQGFEEISRFLHNLKTSRLKPKRVFLEIDPRHKKPLQRLVDKLFQNEYSYTINQDLRRQPRVMLLKYCQK